jgi:hypothetical protein
MGCVESRNKNLTILENELEKTREEKKNLETQINKFSNEYKDGSGFKTFEKSIDEDQKMTLEIEDFFSLLCGGETEYTDPMSREISSLLNLSASNKIIKYSELRIQETKIQYTQTKEIQKLYNQFIEILNTKYQETQTQIQVAENNPNFLNSEEFKLIKIELSYIQDNNRSDFEYLINKLDKIFKIHKILASITKISEKTSPNDNFLYKIKEIETDLLELKKISENNLKALEYKFGMSEVKTSNYSQKNLNNAEVNLETLNTYVKEIIDIETKKNSILANEKIEQGLEWLDITLSSHFSSEELKASIFSKAKRLAGTLDLPDIKKFFFKYAKNSHNSLPDALQVLKEKVEKYLVQSKNQEKIVFQLIENFEKFEEKIDDFELKLDEIISADLKEIQKTMALDDTESRILFEDLKLKLSKAYEKMSKDANEHLEFLHKKIEIYEKVPGLRAKIRDFRVKDINKTKQEFQNTIKGLNCKIDAIEREKSNLKILNHRSNTILGKVSNHVETIKERSKEKEDQFDDLKTKFSSLQEQYDQLLLRLTLSQNEIEVLIKENKECKRNLRLKEIELSDIKKILY